MAFSWSFSKLKSYWTCPRRHYAYDLAPKHQRIKEPESDELIWGNRVHAAMALALVGTQELSNEMQPYQYWVDRVRAGPGQLYVEQKYALTDKLTPCDWFAPVCWYRGIGDAVRIAGPAGLVIDWKTGKPKDENYRLQLALTAQCLFSYFPELKVVRVVLVWLQIEDCTTEEIYRREDMVKLWTEVLPKVQDYQSAVVAKNFPPKPSGICKRYCADVSCPYHGKGSNGART